MGYETDGEQGISDEEFEFCEYGIGQGTLLNYIELVYECMYCYVRTGIPRYPLTIKLLSLSSRAVRSAKHV